MARRQPTPEQRQKAAERRERFQALARMVSAMPADARAALAMKAGIRTIEGRELSIFNQCLLVNQLGTASIVGGFQQWKRGPVGREGRAGSGDLDSDRSARRWCG